MNSSEHKFEATFGWIHHSDERSSGRKTLEQENILCAFSHKENPNAIFLLSTSPGRLGAAMWEYEIESDDIRYISDMSKLDIYTLTGIAAGNTLKECHDDWCRMVNARLPQSDVNRLCDDKIKICSNNPEFEYETFQASPSIDDILDKISEFGIGKLSNSELDILKATYESNSTMSFDKWNIIKSINRKNNDE